MSAASPLRYPGGKTAMAAMIADIRRKNGAAGLTLAEPFAGGAGASLSLLYAEEVPDILINDADPAINDFWWAVTEKPEKFAELIRKSDASVAQWRKQRAVYASRRASRLNRGFSAFYLNRCNRSGIIINGGPIGGIDQTGKWKIDARYNQDTLISRCKKIGEYASRIKVTGLDGLAFIDSVDVANTFLFIDPPYFHKGPLLYLNGLNEEYHLALARKLASLPADASWVLTYDDCKEIRAMYRDWANVRAFSLRYTAAERKKGREVLITPKWMKLPSTQKSLQIEW